MRHLFSLLFLTFLLTACAGPSPRYKTLGGSSAGKVSKRDQKPKEKKKSKSSKSTKSSKKTERTSNKSSGKKSSKKSELNGEASWYGPGFQGKTTANGEKYNMYAMTAAHRTLPFGTIVEVTNLDNGKKVKLRINDRGPYAKGRKYMEKRIIDVSKKAAKKLDMLDKGHARVKLRIIK